ncbi:hypothetical protein NHH82_10235 [Oxalobacteraceae bacterium OTU3REALA1]|nr:hypothetical protein NHH82_10235 [Oxalobacteraceae bacterium OTU3REALA1]
MAAVTIEGVSNAEMQGQEPIADGEEVIDVAEYYGSASLVDASGVRYIQLKHSTVNSTEEWTMSGLKVTLAGFAKRFEKLRETEKMHAVLLDLSFVFATNRPISINVYNALEDALNLRTPRDALASRGLVKYTGLSGKILADFCARLSLEPEHDGFLVQRKALASELRGYLPGSDSEALLQIKELVTRKATSEYAANPAITRIDILRVIGCDDDDLFPAKNVITVPSFIVPRNSEISLVQSIVDAGTAPVIVHAEGGIGKSVFASRIDAHLPVGSVAIVYDCFGNGQYRSPSFPRHGSREGLVQIANELASRTLCPPLIPSGQAKDADYFRAFLTRVGQAVATLRELHKEALLCIVVDAADNAEMAAVESGEGHSFVRKLIRETFPSGVRLVMLCRTHRRHLLNPPPSVIELSVPVFSQLETAAKLRMVFPEASDQDVQEFQRLSSQNPRVQSTALATADSIQDMLRNLGPEPKSVDDIIGRLLEQAVSSVKEEVPKDLQVQFDRICTALAVLRPMVPLSVIASLVQLSTENLRSFLTDLGQSILVKGDLLQFRDEPTETWFQERFKPDQEALREFIAVLRPQASTSAYVAAALPHLLLQAGQMDELIRIALNSSDLPSAHTLETREVEAQRFHFALRASLKCKRYLDASKLALSAGGLAAAEDRQWRTLQDSIDLAGLFLSPEHILRLVAAKEFSAGWTGAHHVYDACVLSSVRDFHGDAQSHIRMAKEWLNNMRTLPEDERLHERIERADISALILANLNVYGPIKAALMIRGCSDANFRYSVASQVASRLVDGGRLDELDEISKNGKRDTALLWAFIQEGARVGHVLPKETVRSAWSVVSRISAQAESQNLDMESNVPSLLAALSWMVTKLEISPRHTVAFVLSRHLGTRRLRVLGSQYERNGRTLVKAYTLQAKLAGRAIKLVDLAYPEWHKDLTKEGYGTSNREIQEFKARAGALMPWYQLWSDIICGEVSAGDVSGRLTQAEVQSNTALQTNYWDKHELKNDIAIAHAEVLFVLGEGAMTHVQTLKNRLLQNDYFTTTLISIVRIVAKHPDLRDFALEVSGMAAGHIGTSNEHAELRADSWTALSRALLTAHAHESKHYFLKSLEVASKIGDENLWRWNAMIHLADAAHSETQPQPKLAYRFARGAELTYDFVHRDKHFDWTSTVEVIASLCPSSVFAILSRWSDRGFGSRQRLLARAVEHLVSRRLLSSSVAAALYGFRAEWSSGKFFSEVVKNTDANAIRTMLAEFMYRYVHVEKHDADTWRLIRDTAVEFKIELPEIESFISHAEHQKQSRDARNSRRDTTRVTESVDWEGIFSNLDIVSLHGLAESQRRYKAVQSYDLGTRFYGQAALRVPLGKEQEFLLSLQDFAEFGIFELRYLLEGIPSRWRKQFSTMEAFQALVRVMITRHSLRISVHHYYQALPLGLIERELNLSPRESISVALSATAEVSTQLGAEQLFELVSLLSKMLTRIEACEALDFELTRLEREMDDSLGDGSWDETLAPPSDIDEAVAGYVWRALAAPERDYRWEAAHVVRGLCELGCRRSVASMLHWLENSPPAQFMDKRFVHYHLHAQLWLLIGCARAAIEKTNFLDQYIHVFTKRAIGGGEKNVLIRDFAAQTALAIAASNPNLIAPERLEHLSSINAPTFNASAPTRGDRLKVRRDKKDMHSKRILHFGIDMPSYWFEPLGSRFGISSNDICDRVEHVVLNVFKISQTQWDDDQRRRGRYYEYQDTSHSHGTYPKSDDLHFYLSFHAMMTVAGELLATMPTAPVDHEDGDYYTFQYWLRGYELTRDDGRWIADRRDPEPLDNSNWDNGEDDKEWRWTVEKADFTSFLLFEPDFVTVSGRWYQGSQARRQEVSVSSALVSADTAQALLVAYQTASDFHFVPSLPRAGESDEEPVEDFELQGWVVSADSESGIDEYDPWAAKIHIHPRAPSDEVCEILQLKADKEKRFWYQDDQTLAMKSRTWSDPIVNDRSEREPNHGLLLQAPMRTLTELMKKTGKSLIFKVSIKRRLSYSYQKDEEDEIKYPAPYILFFLLDENEEFSTL